MAKSEVTETNVNDEAAHLAALDGVALKDIPERDPLLALGTYKFQFVNYSTRFYAKAVNGPTTQMTLQLDPIEVIDVDPDEMQSGFEDLRQFHSIWLQNVYRDSKKVKEFAIACGGDPNAPVFEGGRWGGLEAIKGSYVIATVVDGRTDKQGNPRRAYENFRRA